jgi:hypothetical protein
MPTSVKEITERYRLKVSKTVKWKESVSINDYGIYIVSTSNDLNFLPQNDSEFQLSPEKIALWRRNAPNISLQNKPVSNEELIVHLMRFWLPDETILYIGKAETQFLSDRIPQFYRHTVGKRSPHCGGYWLKLLENVNRLYVHLIAVKKENLSELEENMLQYFIDNVSPTTRELLLDKELCLPFANLQLRSGVIKKHGLVNHVAKKKAIKHLISTKTKCNRH